MVWQSSSCTYHIFCRWGGWGFATQFLVKNRNRVHLLYTTPHLKFSRYLPSRDVASPRSIIVRHILIILSNGITVPLNNACFLIEIFLWKTSIFKGIPLLESYLIQRPKIFILSSIIDKFVSICTNLSSIMIYSDVIDRETMHLVLSPTTVLPLGETMSQALFPETFTLPFMTQ